jgi:hypothetical protein
MTRGRRTADEEFEKDCLVDNESIQMEMIGEKEREAMAGPCATFFDESSFKR